MAQGLPPSPDSRDFSQLVQQPNPKEHYTVEGQLTGGGAEDSYVITGTVGEVVVISVNSTEFSPLVTLQHGREGWHLEIDSGRPSSAGLLGDPALIVWTLPRSGDYTLTIKASGSSSSGAYRLDWTTGETAIALQGHIQVAQAALDQTGTGVAAPGELSISDLAQTLAAYWGQENYLVARLNAHQVAQQAQNAAQQAQNAARQTQVELVKVVRQLQDSDAAGATLERIVARIQTESVDPDEDLNRFTESLLEQLRSHQHWALAEMFLASWQRELERIQASAASPDDAIAATLSYLSTSLSTLPSGQPGTTEVDSLHQMIQQLLIQQLQEESSRPQQALANFNQRFADLIRSQADPGLRQRRLNQAYALYETALSLYEQSFGSNYPLTNRIRQELLGFYGIAGDTVRSQRLMAIQLETLEPQLEATAPPPYEFSLDRGWANSPQGQLLGLYQGTGNYRQAEAILRQILEATSVPTDQAFLLMMLGSVLAAQGDYTGMLQASETANALAQSAWTEAPNLQTNQAALFTYRNSLTGLAYTHLSLGNYDQAEALWQQIQRLEALLPDYSRRDQGLDRLRANLYRRQGAYDQAETIWRRRLAHQSTALHDESTLNLLAELSWANGKFAQAVEFRQRALAVEEDQIIRALSAASDQESQDYIAQFRDPVSFTVSFSLSAADHPPAVALGLTNVLQRKGRTLDLVSARQRYLQEQLAPPTQRLLVQLEEVRSQLSQLIFQPDQPDPQQLSRLQAEAARLEQQLASSTNLVPDNLSEVTAAAVQQQLPAQTALVEYVLYQPYDLNQPSTQALGAPRYMAYVLHPQGEVAAIDLGDAATIDQQVENLRRQLQHPFTPLDAVHQAGRQLHQLLIEPLNLGTAEHLLLAPDGQLNLIPFAALVDENQRYLVERYRLTHLTSGRDLLKVPAPASSNPPLLLGNPDYNQADQPTTASTQRGTGLGITRAPDLRQLQFAQLPGTEAEVTAIAHLLGQATVLTGSTATETALKQAQSPRILHIATHGFFLEDIAPPPSHIAQMATPSSTPSTVMREPSDRSDASQTHPLLRSGLALAGFNPRQSTPDDGVLTALEASTLNLQGTQLVVLSACETGVGDVATGEGVYGLRRALTLAGAESLLTSLWQVDDQATQKLMVDYYQRLLDQSGRSEALRQAQLAMRHNPTYEHPYYWAALMFSGNWRPL
jgi:CHAT domain-containing protein